MLTNPCQCHKKAVLAALSAIAVTHSSEVQADTQLGSVPEILLPCAKKWLQETKEGNDS